MIRDIHRPPAHLASSEQTGDLHTASLKRSNQHRAHDGKSTTARGDSGITRQRNSANHARVLTSCSAATDFLSQNSPSRNTTSRSTQVERSRARGPSVTAAPPEEPLERPVRPSPAPPEEPLERPIPPRRRCRRGSHLAAGRPGGREEAGRPPEVTEERPSRPPEAASWSDPPDRVAAAPERAQGITALYYMDTDWTVNLCGLIVEVTA